MVDPRAGKRYVVSNFGFGWAVQDTADRPGYQRRGRNDKSELSSNLRNARMVELYPTRAQAQAKADELNAGARQAR